MTSWLVRFGEYVVEKPNFIRAGTIGFGVPFAAFMLWFVGAYGDVGWWLFLILVSIIGGFIFASLLWMTLRADFEKIASDIRARKESERSQT